ncbi:MAG: hypothetical protein IPK67_17120 [Planctomycetes bacterium]|nr:hypothetical protein [Planctomycetota bacterium]
MSDSLDPPSLQPPHGVAPAQVALRWAELARAMTLYPESSVRVTRSVEGFLESLHGCLTDDVVELKLAFSASGCWINGQVFDQKEHPGLRWLRERLFRSHLAGAAFSGAVDADSLLTFTKRLLALYTRRNLALTFEELWPSAYGGIHPLERCFDGTFSSDEDQASGGDLPMLAGPGRRGSTDLNDHLAQDASIRAELEDLQAKVIALAGQDAPFREFDLLAEIAALLPEEGVRDHGAASEMTLRILGELKLQLLRPPLDAGEGTTADDATFRRLLSVVSRSHFGRKLTPAASSPPGANEAGAPAASTTPAPGRASGAAADDEELDPMVAEILAAPPEPVSPPAVEDPLEQLGAYLHHLVHCDDPRILPSLERGIATLVGSAGESAHGLLRGYLQWLHAQQGPGAAARVARVVACLTAGGLREHLRRAGLLDVDRVAREFPQGFLDFLQGLKLEDTSDQGELDQVCGEIGPRRLRQAAFLLAGAVEFLAGPFPAALFALPLPSTVPLARMIYAQDPPRFQAGFVRFLRSTVVRGLDAQVFDLLALPESLPPEYLLALADQQPGKVAEQRELCLHGFVTATECSMPMLARHVRAIQMLAHCDSSNTQGLLDRLLKERRRLFFKKHPKAARDAAARVRLLLERAKGTPHV